MRSLKWHQLRFKIALKMALFTVSMPFLILNKKHFDILLSSIQKDFDKLNNLK